MTIRLIALLKHHASLLILAAFSVSYFVAMIAARKILAPDDLYFWNALVTLAAICFTFCFFGAEQLFLRYSTVVEAGRVRINRATLHLMVGALILFTALLTTLSEIYFFQLGNIAIYPVLVLSIGLFVFVYNFLRLLRSFSAAQIAANGWKFTILIGVLLAPMGNAPGIIVAGLGVASAGALVLFARRRTALEISSETMPDQWITLFLGFLLSLFVLMLLSNADRLIMTRYGSKALFSEYVYLVTLLLLPFSLMSNYLGFKELAYLKQNFERGAFRRKTLRVGAFAAVLFMPWFTLIYAAQSLLEVPVHISYALPCLVIVTSRCAYALMSTLFGLNGMASQIHAANFLTLLAIGVAMVGIIVIGVTITSVLILLATFWCARLAIYAWYTSQISEYRARHAL